MQGNPGTVDYLRAAGSWLLDAVFPPHCIGCGVLIDEHPVNYLCARCERALPVRRGFECIGCKYSVKLGVTCGLCASAWSIDRLFIAAPLKEPLVDQLIKLYKYRFISELHRPLAELMAHHTAWAAQTKGFSFFSEIPLITSVPLHPYRQRWRGFNQSEILARDLAGRFQMEYAALLSRTHKTPPQAGTDSKEERMRNLEGIFACTAPDRVRGRSILLIDDICTSGATLDECARVLKQNGARSVAGFVVARG